MGEAQRKEHDKFDFELHEVFAVQVLYEKEAEHVAQFKFTVLLMPNGPHKITGIPLDLDMVESEKSIEDLDIQKLLKTSANPKTAKKKKKAAEKAVAGETVPELVEQ